MNKLTRFCVSFACGVALTLLALDLGKIAATLL
jgi:hypothetical protein